MNISCIAIPIIFMKFFFANIKVAWGADDVINLEVKPTPYFQEKKNKHRFTKNG